jgi:hypothetical protein
MRSVVESGLARDLPPQLVSELLEAYEEAKRNFQLGGHRLGAVEGGRFCEAAYRILQYIATGSYDSLGRRLRVDALVTQLSNLPVGTHADSVRLYIPRALCVIYDIRNNRDTAHLADGIDPNLQDSMLVLSTLDWVMAEFVRLYHKVSPEEAHQLIDEIVTRSVPVIEDFDGFLKVLNPKLGASDYCLVLLFHRGREGATIEEIKSWVRPSMRANLRRTLHRLEHDRALIHLDAGIFRITLSGVAEAERRGIMFQ